MLRDQGRRKPVRTEVIHVFANPAARRAVHRPMSCASCASSHRRPAVAGTVCRCRRSRRLPTCRGTRARCIAAFGVSRVSEQTCERLTPIVRAYEASQLRFKRDGGRSKRNPNHWEMIESEHLTGEAKGSRRGGGSNPGRSSRFPFCRKPVSAFRKCSQAVAGYFGRARKQRICGWASQAPGQP
jgi:hypothetical protein